MGMTLWIHTLEDRDYSKDSDDHSLMHDLADQLDEVCEQLNVQKITEFFDFTDLEYSYTEETDSDDEDNEDELENDLDAEIDPETDLEYGIDDMQWFDAARGLNTLTALHEHIKANSLPDLSEDEENDLLDELEDCIAKLEDTAPRGGKFHLAVVE